MRLFGRAAALALLLGAAASAGADPASPLPPVEPARAGFSTEGLHRIDALLERATDADGYPGAVALIARDGRLVAWRGYGHRDRARTAPMPRDAIFRVYSMSKTVATAAALILVEEGKLELDAPLGEYLPEFAHVQVLAGGDAGAPRLRPPARPITVRDLMTHTAGFASGNGASPAADELLRRADLHGARDLADFAARLSRVPLAADPGTRFAYDGAAIEALGRVIEVASGQPLARFLRERLFLPLGMRDTGFEVPERERARVVDLVTRDAEGRTVLADTAGARRPGARLNAYDSGAGGLYSTAADYARFCQMLLDGGRLGDVRILRRATVAAMFRNQLEGRLQPPVTEFSDAEGFGLGGAVLLDPEGKGRNGAPGQFGWSGAASTYYSIDPRERLVAILLLQYLPRDDARDPPKLATPFFNLVHEAIAP